MYYVKLDNQIVCQTTDKMIAIINYRYLLRRADLVNDEHSATLLEDNLIIHHHTINTQTATLDVCTSVHANDIFLAVKESKNLSVNDIKSIIKRAGLLTTNSKISGWLSQKDNRKHQAMSMDELYIMMQEMIKYDVLNADAGYSPNNLKDLISITGMTNADFSRAFDISLNTLYANLADVSNAKHRSMSYKTWLELVEKVKAYQQ